MKLASENFEDIVIGGGFFGATLAIELSESGRRVLLVEREPQILCRASYTNQARVHGGYHYPRSFLTAKRSRANFLRFVQAYESAVISDFRSYYAIAKDLSHVSAHQFKEFCRRVGAPLRPAAAAVCDWFDMDRIEAVFEVEEFALNAGTLRRLLEDRLERNKIQTLCSTEAHSIEKAANSLLVRLTSGASPEYVGASQVWLCGYSGINQILAQSSLPLVPLRSELAELCLVTPPEELKDCAVTVMDGPFFSMMPFPALGKHTLTHVRYTPHTKWDDGGQPPPGDCFSNPPPSQYEKMVRDASRFLPALRLCRYEKSLWEIKSLLPASETNDSRPILFNQNHGLPGLHCVLGGKLDNIFDALDISLRKVAA